MTWKGLTSIIEFIEKTYAKGVTLAKKVLERLEERLVRSPTPYSSGFYTLRPNVVDLAFPFLRNSYTPFWLFLFHGTPSKSHSITLFILAECPNPAGQTHDFYAMRGLWRMGLRLADLDLILHISLFPVVELAYGFTSPPDG